MALTKIPGSMMSGTLVSKSATYAVTHNDDIIVCSGASFTVTLPTAVGVSGKHFVIVHNGTSLTQVYTLASTSSQTIGGVSAGSYVLYSNGDILRVVSDGSNWIVVSPNPRGIYKSVTTSGTSIDSATIPAWARKITILFQGISTSGTSEWIVQLADGGGVETTSYLSTSARTPEAANPNVEGSTAGFIMNADAATFIMSGKMELQLIDPSTNTWISTHVAKINGGQIVSGGGEKALSATLTSVRLTTAGGADTFDAGNWTVMWE
jgi:hypothetical protein